MVLLRLALRSLLRNKRRSGVTLAAVAIGVMIVVLAHGFGEGLAHMMVNSLIDSRIGALQIHKKGYAEKSETAPLTLDMAVSPALLARIQAVPGVVAAAPRVRFGAMLGDGTRSTLVMAEGLDVARERAVCPARVWAESFERTPASIEIGAELAQSFGAKPGDELTLSAAARLGALNASGVQVSGVSRGASSLLESKRLVQVPLAFAQELLQMHDDAGALRATEIAVRVHDLQALDAVVHALQTALGPEVEVLRWDEVMPFLRDATARLGWVLRGVSLILFLVVVLGVVNTMLMNVHERTREIGTLLAVGARRRQVQLLFLCEAGVIGMVGGSLGALAGLAVTQLLAWRGIPMTPPGALFPQIIHPVARADLAVLAAGVAVLGALLAALWPARKASLLDPVEALRGT